MIFFSIAAIVLILAYSYIGWRVITPSGLEVRKKRIAWALLLSWPLSLPASYLLRFSGSDTFWGDVIGWVAYISLGFFSLVFILLLLRDAGWVILALTGKFVKLLYRAVISLKPRVVSYDPERRNLLIRSMNLGILGTAGFFTGYGFYEARRKPTVVNISVPINGLPPGFEGFRIAQISDIHVGPTIKRDHVSTVVEMVDNLGADVIVFTGDLVDGTVPILSKDVAPLGELAAPKGTFFVTGNHEYYSGAMAWIEEIDRLGLTVLLNENRVLENHGSRLILAGVTDYNAGGFIGSHVSDPATAISDAPDEAVKILLAHQPRSVYKAAEEGFDLQISGHTHGGQNLFWSSLVALTQPFIRGLHKYKDTWVYVNSGTGYWGPPLRVGVPSEITLITLRTQ
ncbi:MAG: metallophosphoesterase [Candidatus Glassbacteria bacterium]